VVFLLSSSPHPPPFVRSLPPPLFPLYTLCRRISFLSMENRIPRPQVSPLVAASPSPPPLSRTVEEAHTPLPFFFLPSRRESRRWYLPPPSTLGTSRFSLVARSPLPPSDEKEWRGPRRSFFPPAVTTETHIFLRVILLELFFFDLFLPLPGTPEECLLFLLSIALPPQVPPSAKNLRQRTPFFSPPPCRVNLPGALSFPPAHTQFVLPFGHMKLRVRSPYFFYVLTSLKLSNRSIFPSPRVIIVLTDPVPFRKLRIFPFPPHLVHFCVNLESPISPPFSGI